MALSTKRERIRYSVLTFSYTQCEPSQTPTDTHVLVKSTAIFTLTSPPPASTLYKIMWTVIDVLYECNLGPPDGGVLPVASSTLQIEHQLLEWQATLGGPLSSLVTPAELQRDDDFGGDNDLAPHEQQGQGQHFSSSPERRFRVILTLRYHNVRILAHRRMLDLYLASLERGLGSYDAEDSMLRQVGQRSKSICFQSASDLIAIVGVLTRSKEPKRGLLGAWWFTLYYSQWASDSIYLLMCWTSKMKRERLTDSKHNSIQRHPHHRRAAALYGVQRR